MKNLKLISGNSNFDLAYKIANEMNIEIVNCDITNFADGEVQIEIHESVRGTHVFVIQSTCPPVNQNAMELFMLLDAIKRASAKNITSVVPYYGYARQDRKVSPRAPISAKCMADLLQTAGANRIVSVDLHAAQIQGFFNVPVDHLYAIPTFAKSWKEIYGKGYDFVTISPDAGGVERARFFAKRIESSLAIIDKRRSGPNEAKALHLVGEVKGKVAIVVDDLIDTSGTLIQAVDTLLKNGAKKVVALATHAVFSPPAIERISKSRIEEVWVSNSIPLSEEAKKCNKIKVISIAPLIAEALKRIYSNDSVSSLFD